MKKLSAKQQLRLEKSGLLLALMLPLARIILDYFQDSLGANPVEAMTHRTGDAAIKILLLSLAVTPIQRHFRFRRAILFRRLLGLTAFFYALLHFAVYLIFDQELSFSDTFNDVVKRPYITMGFSSLVILLPLAITSTDKMIKRMGGPKWRRLHKAVYAAAVLAVIHYWWLVKADLTAPIIYAVCLIVLLSTRFAWWARQRNNKPVIKQPG
jgi:methionine sulfoxide reductase heme-binding subunit